MPFKIVQRKHYRDTVDFVSDQGNQISVTIDLDLATATKKYWPLYEALYKAQEDLEKDPQNQTKQEDFGKAMLNLMRFVFGDSKAHKIVEFYSGRESELVEDLLPFLCNVVYSHLKKYAFAQALKDSKFVKKNRLSLLAIQRTLKR